MTPNMWSSSFRGRVYIADTDSNSDGDVETDDAHLVREMDLAARHETVEYRPNPWTIARINAASRPPPKPAPVAPAPTPQPKPIVEAFKKQAKRGPRGDVVRAARHHPVDKPAEQSFATKSDADEGRLLHAQQPGRKAQALDSHISTSGTFNGTHGPALVLPIGGPRSHACVSAHTMHPSLPSLEPGMNNEPKTNTTVVACPLPVNTGHKAPPKWLSVVNQGPVLVPPLLPESRHGSADPCTRTPEQKHKRLASPEPVLPRKTPRALAPRPPTASTSAYPTAYAFGQDDDPDADWSTLTRTGQTTTKRAAKPKPDGVKQSGHFRLPLLGVAAPPTARRVITYLPPPRPSKKLVDDVNPMAMVDPEAAKEEEEEELFVMDSDMTLVNEDEDVAQIDVDDVCKRYPTTRACMKAARRVRKVLGCIVEVCLIEQ